MADNLLVYSAPAVVGDPNNTANAYVKRDANGSTLQSVVVAGNSVPSSVPAGAIAHVNGGASFQAYQTLTGNTTLTAGSPKINYVDATSGAFAVTLPLFGTSDMIEFEFYKIDGAHNVTITGAGSDNIQLGATTANTAVMSTQGGKLTVRRGVTNWRAA